MKKIKALCWIAMCILLLVSVRAAQSAVDESDALYLYDRESALTIDEVLQRLESGAITESLASAEIPVGDGNHWVIVQVDIQYPGDLNKWLLEIDFPNIDRVDAYVESTSGGFRTYTIGDEVAFLKWPVSYRKPSVPLGRVGESGVSVILKVKSETPLILPLNLITAMEQNNIQRQEHFFYGVFFGAIFILALYNAGVYFSLRDKSYRFYILYILAFAMVQASTTGLGQQYLWPWLDNATTRIALLSMMFINFFMINFVIYFLDIGNYRPVFLKPMRVLAALALLLSPLLLLEHYSYAQFAIHGVSFVSMALIVAASVSVLKSNRRPAIYLLASYSVLFSTIMMALLFQADVVERYRFMDYSISFAILLEAIILSIGLSERIAQLRIENEKSERERRISQEKLSQKLIQAREKERSQISKLLHDSVNHDLVVVQKKIEQLGNGFVGKTSPALGTSAIGELLDSAISEIRNISHLTHPQVVEHLGLEPALRALLESTFDSSVSWQLYMDEVDLDYDAKLFLYRAVQEATTNIIKHANASECLVRLQRDDANARAQFILKDDGDGFNASRSHWGFGLKTLNAHCKSVAGVLKIKSVPMEGTVVTIFLPLKI